MVGLGILVGNITGFFRIAFTAYLLGTHAKADALAVAMGPIDAINTAAINTMLVAFVPMLMLRHGPNRVALFLKAGSLFAGIFAVVAALVGIFASPLISVLGPGLAPEQHQEATVLLRWLAPCIFFAGTSAICAALLYTERKFVIQSLYQATINGGMIVIGLAFWETLGARSLVLGYTAGAALQLLLTYSASRRLRNEPAVPCSMPVSEILAGPGMFVAYATLVALNIVATRAFATHAGPGLAAALDYSLRCMNVVVAYLVYPISNSLVPEIGRLRSVNDTRHANRLIDRSLALMGLAAIGACIVGFVVRTPAIQILFQRGNFTSESTLMVSAVFVGLLPSIAGWAMLDLISRCQFALDRPKLPVLAAFIPVSVNLLFLGTLHLQKKLDPMVLGFGASLGWLAGFAVLFVATHVGRRSTQQEPEPLEAVRV